MVKKSYTFKIRENEDQDIKDFLDCQRSFTKTVRYLIRKSIYENGGIKNLSDGMEFISIPSNKNINESVGSIQNSNFIKNKSIEFIEENNFVEDKNIDFMEENNSIENEDMEFIEESNSIEDENIELIEKSNSIKNKSIEEEKEKKTLKIPECYL